MIRSLTARYAALTRPELVAGIGVVLIVSGLVLRFAGSTIVLPAVAQLRALSDQAITLFIHAVGLFEILVGIVLLAVVATHVRRRSSARIDRRTSDL